MHLCFRTIPKTCCSVKVSNRDSCYGSGDSTMNLIVEVRLIVVIGNQSITPLLSPTMPSSIPAEDYFSLNCPSGWGFGVITHWGFNSSFSSHFVVLVNFPL